MAGRSGPKQSSLRRVEQATRLLQGFEHGRVALAAWLCASGTIPESQNTQTFLLVTIVCNRDALHHIWACCKLFEHILPALRLFDMDFCTTGQR
eukprot:s71_g14.t1